MTEWTIIGVPTSAGAHHAGQDRAPAALRKAGLVERLTGAGVTVHDAGDLPGGMFALDREHPEARNLAGRQAGERRLGRRTGAGLQRLSYRQRPAGSGRGRVSVRVRYLAPL